MKKKYYLYQMNLKILNIMSFVILFIMLLISYVVDKNFLLYSIDYVFSDNIILKFFLLYILYIIIHEILHSIAYVIYGASFKKIEYGMEIEKGILYCLCKQNISRKNILNSLIFPLFYIGIVTYIISIIFKLPTLYFLSIFNIMGCVGDIIMFIFIVRLDKSINFSELDDTTSFAIKSSKDISKINHFGLKYLGTKNELERNINKKINISKISLIFILMILFVLIISAIN